MKLFSLFYIFLVGCFHSKAQTTFYYKVTTITPESTAVTKLFIAYEIGGIKFVDSVVLKKNPPALTVTIAQPAQAIVYTDIADIVPIPVMLANNFLSIEIRDRSISVEKSTLQDDFLTLTANDRIRPDYFPLYGELNARNDTAGLSRLGLIFDSLKTDDINKSLKYFKTNATSLLSLFAFKRFTAFFADYSKVEDDFYLLPTWAQESPDGKNILAKIMGAKAAQVNTRAKNFEQFTPTGQKISLKNYLGKYVLLDFWASWCAPCRKEHPHLIQLYKQFNEAGFEILSISLDTDRINWLNAIKQDKLIWSQVSDLKGQQNEIAILYGVQSIPANFLVNPAGVIIDKNIKMEQLNEKLTTLLIK